MPKKVYLQGVLLHYFIQKKSATEAHRIIVDTYSDHASVRKKNADIVLDASKIKIMTLKIKNALAHKKNLKMKNWRHYFMKTHVRFQLNLQNH